MKTVHEVYGHIASCRVKTVHEPVPSPNCFPCTTTVVGGGFGGGSWNKIDGSLDGDVTCFVPLSSYCQGGGSEGRQGSASTSLGSGVPWEEEADMEVRGHFPLTA